MTWLDTLARTLFPDRCHQWRLGPFDTDWRCLKSKKHPGDHVYEPQDAGPSDRAGRHPDGSYSAQRLIDTIQSCSCPCHAVIQPGLIPCPSCRPSGCGYGLNR